MHTPAADVSEQVMLERNHRFYDGLWRDARLVLPDRFNTWPMVEAMAKDCRDRLEVAPGLRPRLPVAGTMFADIAAPALGQLIARGGHGVCASVTALPFPDRAFDLVCAFDIVEHVRDDDAALAELSRVTRPDAHLLLSVPLHMHAWTDFDRFVGHYRRYEPDELGRKLAAAGFVPERSAVHGMQPKASRMLDLGMWYLNHQRQRAMWWYNRLIMPLGIRLQKKLDWRPGLIDDADVDTVAIVCRRAT